MSDDNVRPATLEPIDASDVHALAGELIAANHPTLTAARIRWFWALNKPAKWWGRPKVCTEVEWWLAKGSDDEADLIIQINSSLWQNLGPAGRRFLVDLLLSALKRKEGGKTIMETKDGDRTLYEKITHTLGVDPEVLARHPAGFAEIKELKELDRAMHDGAQFLLDLQAIREAVGGGEGDGDDDGDGEDEDGDDGVLTAHAHAEGDPIYYYGTHRFETGLRAGWLVYLRYNDAAKTPASLVGVHFPADQKPQGGGDDPVNKALLDFDDSPSAVKTYRADLETELLDRRLAALEESKAAEAGEPLDVEWIEPAPTPEDEEIDQSLDDAIEDGELTIPALAGGDILPMRRRG